MKQPAPEGQGQALVAEKNVAALPKKPSAPFSSQAPLLDALVGLKTCPPMSDPVLLAAFSEESIIALKNMESADVMNEVLLRKNHLRALMVRVACPEPATAGMYILRSFLAGPTQADAFLEG